MPHIEDLEVRIQKAEKELDDFFKLVECMRNAQDQYFKWRTSAALKRAKEWEKRVDVEIKERNDNCLF